MSPRLAFLIFLFGIAPVLPAQSPTSGGTPPPEVVVRELVLTVGKALLIESASPVLRISIGNGEIAEAVPVAPREVVINGKAAGQTNLILWDQGGNKRLFDIKVRPPMLEAARRQLAGVLKDQDVTLELEGDAVFVRGTVKDLVSAERAMAIAGTLGKPVNLLDVLVPPVEAQILLKVRFANVDRGATSELGANIMSMGKMPARGTTGQFSPPAPQESSGAGTSFTFSDALNIFLFRPDLNLATTIRALQAKSLVEILAEPNVLTVDGKRASFLAGGEFPFPTLQGGGGGIGQVTVQFREFGIRLSFLPRVTPRGTIRLEVAPEVSSLDYAKGLVVQGFTIPGLDSRKVQTEIELESGQSFAIAGLLDNRVSENLSKIPGLGDVPLLGHLFRSRARTRNHSELLILVTPELVRPLPAGQTAPALRMPVEFMQGVSADMPRTPGVDVTGPVPVKPMQQTIPIQELLKPKQAVPVEIPGVPPVQFIPVPVAPPAGAQETGRTGANPGNGF